MKQPLTAVLAGLLVLAACGQEPSAQSSPTPSDPVETTGPVLEDPAALLLTLEDLPEGFVVESSTTEGIPAPGADEEVEVISGPEACARLFDTDSGLHETAVVDYAAIGFAGGDFGPFFDHAINVYPPEGTALDDEFALYEDVLDDCDGTSVTIADAEGARLAMDLSRLDLAGFGDRSSALAMDGVLLEYGVAVQTVFVLVQVGDTTSSFSSTGMNGEVFDEQTFTELVSVAVERLEAEFDRTG